MHYFCSFGIFEPSVSYPYTGLQLVNARDEHVVPTRWMRSEVGTLSSWSEEELANRKICGLYLPPRRIILRGLLYDCVSGMDTFKVTGLSGYEAIITCGDDPGDGLLPLLAPSGDEGEKGDDDDVDFTDMFNTQPRKRPKQSSSPANRPRSKGASLGGATSSIP